jgi:hypothetical protein
MAMRCRPRQKSFILKAAQMTLRVARPIWRIAVFTWGKSNRQGWKPMPNSTHHAAILKRRAPGANISIVEPARDHYYQPAFTLVGAGVYRLARTRHAEESLIPVGVQWIRNAAQTFEPEKNMVSR